MRDRKIYETMPDDLISRLSELGSDISAARRVRQLSQEDLAQRMNVGRRTVSRMEQGDHRVSFGAFMTAAWIMGLENNLLTAFGTEADPVQQREARLGLPRRIDGPRRKSGKVIPADIDENDHDDIPQITSSEDRELDF
ncbi:helix-turn-helix domain-containing protein [Pseudosulfitobacter pseudonitzschiae]|uniref:helix-turn-helix domain-containing protein n=1 Tax=Pseudosulfitobacter pseudonitzschiae TaxID=1402135 RepID=UPI003B7AD14E